MAIYRIPTLARVVTLTLALAACSDSSSLAPRSSSSIATAALPEAARYIVRLNAAGPVPSTLAAAIAADGGRVVRTHAGTGLVVVAGLTAAQAKSLRAQPGVGVVAADMQRRWIHEAETVRPLQVSAMRASPAAAGHPARALGAPAQAPAFTSGSQWYLTNIGADTAWGTSTQGAGQTIYVLDTGVDTAHVELVGRVDTKHSTSFASAPAGDSVLPFGHDVAGHGTFVSSIITTNGAFIASVAPQAKLVMVRVLDDQGSGFDSDILSGVLYAADSGATVISMSLGGYLDRTSNGDLAFADFFQRAVNYATARGALIVVAAGNENVNTNTAQSGTGSFADSLNVPAGLHHLISVGATGPIDKANFNDIAQYSNFGLADVAVFAPGGNDLDGSFESTINFADWIFGACSSAISGGCLAAGENSYNAGIGTSFATPMVSAQAAILIGQGAKIPPAALESCILNSAAPFGTGKGDINYNFGRISIPSALATSGC
jgi:subtilisin family serine protease